jgi:hypothetical protein
MPALPSIIAKILALTDSVLGVFVTVDATTMGACNLTRYSANMTACGDEMVDSIANMLFNLAEIGNQILGALVAT